MATTLSRKSACLLRHSLLVLLSLAITTASAITLDVKAVKLSTEQQASLQRHAAETLPARTFDWTTLSASATAERGRLQPLLVTLTTVPALSAAGVCQREEHHFTLESAGGKRNAAWRANADLTRFQAWMPQRGDCMRVADAIDVDRTLSDRDILFLLRQNDALRSRAAGVIAYARSRS